MSNKSKYLNKEERNFLVCSDCAFFQQEEIIDKRYPNIKKGRCIKHHKEVNNIWEIDCKDNTCFCCCDQCIYFEYQICYNEEDEDGYDEHFGYCSYKHFEVEETENVCESFKAYYYN